MLQVKAQSVFIPLSYFLKKANLITSTYINVDKLLNFDVSVKLSLLKYIKADIKKRNRELFYICNIIRSVATFAVKYKLDKRKKSL